MSLVVYRVIIPLLFADPSTFNTGMGFDKGRVGIRFLMTYFESMNWPSAPESIRADAEMFLSNTHMLTGMRKVESDSCVLITYEIDLGGASISLGLLFKNPLSQATGKILPFGLQRILVEWL